MDEEPRTAQFRTRSVIFNCHEEAWGIAAHVDESGMELDVDDVGWLGKPEFAQAVLRVRCC